MWPGTLTLSHGLHTHEDARTHTRGQFALVNLDSTPLLRCVPTTYPLPKPTSKCPCPRPLPSPSPSPRPQTEAAAACSRVVHSVRVCDSMIHDIYCRPYLDTRAIRYSILGLAVDTRRRKERALSPYPLTTNNKSARREVDVEGTIRLAAGHCPKRQARVAAATAGLGLAAT